MKFKWCYLTGKVMGDRQDRVISYIVKLSKFWLSLWVALLFRMAISSTSNISEYQIILNRVQTKTKSLVFLKLKA